MKIDDLRKNEHTFKDLDVGGVFEFLGEIYMKSVSDDGASLNLQDGEIKHFDSNAHVKTLKYVKLVIGE